MVLDKKRETIDPMLTFLAQKVQRVPADVFTWFALVFSFLSGFFFYISTPENEIIGFYLIFASLFIFLNGLFDAIDGKIAKLTKTTSLRGDFLDHAIDRYADVFIVGGIAFSQWCDMHIGILALIGVLLTSYMGTQAQAVGFHRLYAGLLGRADRLVILMIVPLVQHLFLQINLEVFWNFTLIEWAMIYLAVIGNVTAVQRFYTTLKYFKNEKK